MIYKCYGCGSEHSTDNMVAYCASCYTQCAERSGVLNRNEVLEEAAQHLINMEMDNAFAYAEEIRKLKTGDSK